MFFPAFLFSIGLIIGSFLNVVLFRYSPCEKRGDFFNFRNWRGRSHCLSCGKILKWYELAPILSFVLQRGKCRHCNKNISWQYPLVELAAGFIFLFPLYLSAPGAGLYSFISGAIWILTLLIFLLVWIVDFRFHLIPNELTSGLAALGIGKALLDSAYKQFGELSGSFLGQYALLFGLRDSIWFNHFAAALIGGLFFGFIIYVSKGRGMGMGDLKLTVALGLVFGWPDILFIMAFAFFIGALFGIVLIIAGKKTMKSRIAFGPFVILGALGTMFFGQQILSYYFSLFG